MLSKLSLALRNSKDGLLSAGVGVGWFLENVIKGNKVTVLNNIAEAIKQLLETAQFNEYSICSSNWPS